MYSECCGASEWLEDTGICSECKEHCEFIDDDYDADIEDLQNY
jgi:hypothetical protein